jgi:hypothetical protein
MRDTLANVYVVCFCEKPNLLSQWRAYGQSGGYSIGFNRDALTNYRTEGNTIDVQLEQVIYDESQQATILSTLIADGIPALNEPNVAAEFEKLTLLGKATFLQLYLRSWEHFALREIVRFKPPSFEDEREWRLIAQLRDRSLKADEELKLVKFRPLRGVPTPYLELKPQAGLHPITSVRYGPTLDKKRAEHGLRLLFKKRGYSEIAFSGSEIPVRL